MIDVKRKTVNSSKEYFEFVLSVPSMSAWKDSTFENLKEVHGAPAKYPCDVVAKLVYVDLGEEDSFPGLQWQFGVEKQVLTFFKFDE